jgi:hypothetical protein
MRAILCTLALCAVLSAVRSGMADEAPELVTWYTSEPEAICDTDTDCAQYCPPPSDEPECDGGPQ